MIKATLRGKKIKTILDYRAIGNFISLRTLARVNVLIQNIDLYELLVIDRIVVVYNNEIITQGTMPSRLKLEGEHSESI
jgi:hypothetical protein